MSETTYIALNAGIKVFYVARDLGSSFITIYLGEPRNNKGSYCGAQLSDYVGSIGYRIADLWGIPTPEEGQFIQVICRFEILSQQSCSSVEKEVSS